MLLRRSASTDHPSSDRYADTISHIYPSTANSCPNNSTADSDTYRGASPTHANRDDIYTHSYINRNSNAITDIRTKTRNFRPYRIPTSQRS